MGPSIWNADDGGDLPRAHGLLVLLRSGRADLSLMVQVSCYLHSKIFVVRSAGGSVREKGGGGKQGEILCKHTWNKGGVGYLFNMLNRVR